MRVLVVDDDALVRAGIHALVATLPDVTEVVEAADGHQAVAAVAEHDPDVVLMDITLPGISGLEATRRMTKESPMTRVIIVSMHRSAEFVRSAFHVGASGYVLKASAAGELKEALRAVMNGKTYVSPLIQKTLEGIEHTASIPLEELTLRQREVLRLIAEGLSSRQIAESLRIQVKTVETHRTAIMRRLDIHDVAGLVRYATRHGLVPSTRR